MYSHIYNIKYQLDEHDRRNLIRNKRNFILSDPIHTTLKPELFPKGDSLFVGPNAVCDHVDPQKVTVSMSLQHKHTTDSLQLLQVEQRQIDKMLQREFQEINVLFPAAISMASNSSMKQAPFLLMSEAQNPSLRSTSSPSPRFRPRSQQRSEIETNLSTRFDSASVPLKLVRPQLPTMIKRNHSR